MALALVTGAGLHWVKSDTRRLEARTQALERRIERTEADTRAAEANLNKAIAPERLEPLARHEIGLKPIDPRQIVRAEDITRARFHDNTPPRKP
jgi:hypothetical protein